MPDSSSPAAAPERSLLTYQDLAARIDFPLLGPAFPEQQISDGCDFARHYNLGSVTVRPSDAQLAVKWLDGSGVRVASVAGFPHGNETTTVKLYAIRDLISRGIGEIETCWNVGKLISRQFEYVEMELMQMAEECHKANVRLRVTLENHLLGLDHKVIGYKILKRAGVDSARAAGIFGPPMPVVMDDLQLMIAKLGGRVEIDAGKGPKTLDELKSLYTAGCDRFALIQPAPVLDAWQREVDERAKAAAAAAGAQPAISDTDGTSPS